MNRIFTAFSRNHPRLIIPVGLLAGLLSGVIARAWMRWISTDPEFSWSGTLGIVIGFTIFGAIQATVYVVRKKRLAILARGIGTIFSLQLFVAAGAIMFPTVLTLSLALWREAWIPWVRVSLAVIGTAIWVLIIKSEIIDNFGWSIVTIGRILLFGCIYAPIIWALGATVKPLKKPSLIEI